MAGSARPTLESVPYKVKQHPLQQRDVARSHPPREAVLDGEADMPSQAAPRDEDGEEAAETTRNDDYSHGLADRQALGQERVGGLPCCYIERRALGDREYNRQSMFPARLAIRGTIQNLQRPGAKEVEPAPRATVRRKGNQITVRPGAHFFFGARFVGLESHGLLYSSKHFEIVRERDCPLKTSR